MKNKYRVTGAVILAAAILCAAGRAEASGVGTTGGAFLKVGVGARSLGMGGASVATVSDANSIYWNPAGLAALQKKHITASYNTLFVDQSQGFIALALPLKKYMGAVGLGVNYLLVSDIERRTRDSESADYAFSNSNVAVTMSYAEKGLVNDRTALGASVKFIRTNLDTFRKNAFALDLGAIYDINDQTTAGLAVQNLGSKLGPDQLPLVARPGIATRLLEKKLVLALDLEAWIRDKRTYVDFGAEYWVVPAMALRAGYQFNRSQDKLGGATGLGAGFGIRIHELNLDYAFVPFGDLGNTHRMSIGLRF